MRDIHKIRPSFSHFFVCWNRKLKVAQITDASPKDRRTVSVLKPPWQTARWGGWNEIAVCVHLRVCVRRFPIGPEQKNSMRIPEASEKSPISQRRDRVESWQWYQKMHYNFLFQAIYVPSCNSLPLLWNHSSNFLTREFFFSTEVYAYCSMRKQSATRDSIHQKYMSFTIVMVR